MLRLRDAAAIGLAVTDTVWTSYAGAETLACPQGTTPVLEIMSGGFVPAAILVDHLQIARLH